MIGRRTLLAVLVGLALLLGAVSDAGAGGLTPQLYWAWGNSIGEAGLDGTAANPHFVDGALSPYGVAVDGQHVYWANESAGTIGRANLDGSGATDSFITGATNPIQMAVDGEYLYWANLGSDTIARASLDGTSVDESFITGARSPLGIAVDGGHIYWGNLSDGTIGRANLDGSGVDESFISGASVPYGVAVDGGHIYWSNEGAGTIGRANLDGTGVDQAFISGATGPIGVATDARYIYWANYSGGSIGRANLDGTDIEQSFVSADHPIGLAVQAVPDAPTDVSADAGIGEATVSFTAPAANGSPIGSYTVTADPGGETATGSASPITVNGLDADSSYTFTVTATNDVGTSDASAASNGVEPTGPPDAARSTLTPVSANIAANGSATQILTVTARDAGGIDVAGGGATVAFTRTAGSGSIGPVSDHGDGTYSATVTAPASVGSGTFSATIGGDPVESGRGSQTLATIRYWSQPAVTGVSPSSGGVHSTVTVTGTNFTGLTQVKLNGTNAAFSVVSDTELTLTVPQGAASSGHVFVANAGASAVSVGTFAVNAQPAIGGFSPGNGSVGTSVTITGTNLAGTVAVELGSVLTVPTSVSSTSVVFTVPPGAVTGTIRILSPNGSATSSGTFTVVG